MNKYLFLSKEYLSQSIFVLMNIKFGVNQRNAMNGWTVDLWPVRAKTFQKGFIPNVGLQIRSAEQKIRSASKK